MARFSRALATAAAVTATGCFALDWDYRDAPFSAGGGGGGGSGGGSSSAGGGGSDPCAGAGDPCSTGMTGACAAGTLVCTGGALVCQPDIAPDGVPEVCNGADDDCDGSFDESDSGMPICPCDVVVYSDHPYLLCAQTLAWLDARDLCLSVGYHLATINDLAENSTLRTLMSQIPVGLFWIGYNDIAQEGVFVWEDGSPAGFENWNNGEPNGASLAEDCTQVFGSGSWNDEACTAIFPFVCEAGAP
jgi:hypothetical protein